MDVQRFLQAAQQGDCDSYNSLILNYQDLVYDLVGRVLGDEDAAVGVTQHVFIQAFKDLHTFRGGAFRIWLLRKAVQVCGRKLDRNGRKMSAGSNAGAQPRQSLAAAPENTRARPEARPGGAAVFNNSLNQGLRQLPLDVRLVLVLVDIEGLDYRDAAEVLEIPVRTVGQRLAQGRCMLSQAAISG